MDATFPPQEPSPDLADPLDVEMSPALPPAVGQPGRSIHPRLLGLTTAVIVLAAIGLIATVMSAMLTDQNQSFGIVSSALPVVAVGSTLAAVVIGIVLLERRARGRSVLGAAVGVAAIGCVVATATLVPLPDLAVHVYGYACPYYVTSLAGESGTWLGRPLAYGSSITEADAMQGKPWTTFTVDRPIDVTEVARDAGVRPPRSGAYFAIPVTRGAVDDSGMMCEDPVKTSPHWFDASGTARSAIPLALAGYPGGGQGGRDNGDGTVTYYVIFDITPEAAGTGAFALSQMISDQTQPTEVFWGGDRSAVAVPDPMVADPLLPFSPLPAETAAADDTSNAATTDSTSDASTTDGAPSTTTDLYVADDAANGSTPDVPLSFGEGLTMQSVRSGKDALKFVVSAPIDITAAARAAGVTAPTAGAYIAVPITATEIDVAALTDAGGVEYPAGYWATSDDEVDSSSIDVPGYPVLQNVDTPNPDGTWSYFEIFDVPASAATDGQYELALPGRDRTGQYWYWGAPQS